jgi:hypothetical protein
VIRGGAYSAGELDAALRADPVAAAHYAVFDRTQLRIVAKEPRQPASVYVSYRQGDRIYWTRRKVRLAAQETLLTDGVHLARARCGNRISLTAPEPAQAGEPDVDLDVPEPPAAARADDAPDVVSLPMLVHEIFPAFLRDFLPDSGPGGSPASPPGNLAGTAYPISHAGPSPPGYRFPLLPVVTLPQPVPNVWPIDFTTLPLPPAGPGTGRNQPTLPPGGAVAGAPPLPGTTNFPEIPTVPGATLSPNVNGDPPPPHAPGAAQPETVAGEPEPAVPGEPDTPLPNTLQTPEPASAALLICGLLALACRRRFTRRRE